MEQPLEWGDPVNYKGELYYCLPDGPNSCFLYTNLSEVGLTAKAERMVGRDQITRCETTSMGKPLQSGDRVSYGGKPYYYQPNGTSCYLYATPGGIGHPMDAKNMVPQDQITRWIEHNRRPDLTDGQWVLYHDRVYVYQYNMEKDQVDLRGNENRLVYEVRKPDSEGIKKLPVEPGTAVMYYGPQRTTREVREFQMYRFQCDKFEEEWELVDHLGRCFEFDPHGDGGPLHRHTALSMLQPVPPQLVDPIFLYNELMALKTKLDRLKDD